MPSPPGGRKAETEVLWSVYSSISSFSYCMRREWRVPKCVTCLVCVCVYWLYQLCIIYNVVVFVMRQFHYLCFLLVIPKKKNKSKLKTRKRTHRPLLPWQRQGNKNQILPGRQADRRAHRSVIRNKWGVDKNSLKIFHSPCRYWFYFVTLLIYLKEVSCLHLEEEKEGSGEKMRGLLPRTPNLGHCWDGRCFCLWKFSFFSMPAYLFFYFLFDPNCSVLFEFFATFKYQPGKQNGQSKEAYQEKDDGDDDDDIVNNVIYQNNKLPRKCVMTDVLLHSSTQNKIFVIIILTGCENFFTKRLARPACHCFGWKDDDNDEIWMKMWAKESVTQFVAFVGIAGEWGVSRKQISILCQSPDKIGFVIRTCFRVA